MTRLLRTSFLILAPISSTAASPSVTLVLTGESVGYLEPCGCTIGQLGGIARRHTYLRNLQVNHRRLLLLDLGDLSAGFGRQEQLKAETFVNAMNEMGYAAAAVGDRDVFLGLNHLAHLQREVAKFAMLCGNLIRSKADGSTERLFPASTTVSAGIGGPRTLLVGLLSKEADELVQAIEPSLRVTDPSKALREAMGDVEQRPSFATVSRPWLHRRGQETTPNRAPSQTAQARHGLLTVAEARSGDRAEQNRGAAGRASQGGRPHSRAVRPEAREAVPGLIVVLAHMPQAEAAALAQAVPSVDFVLCGGDRVKPPSPKQVGKTWVVTCGAQGKYLVEVSFPWSRGVVALRPDIATVALDDRYPDSSDMLAILDGYQASLKREQLLAKRPRNVFGNGMAYVGSRACAECHKEHFARWRGHRHAVAYQTLRRRKRHHDPECVGCHVVGLDYASGFRNGQRTPDLAGVGCESCHGPGNLHCEQSKRKAQSRASSAAQSHSQTIASPQLANRQRLRAVGATDKLASSVPHEPSGQHPQDELEGGTRTGEERRDAATAPSPTRYGKTDETTCTDCHDSAHDPKQRYKLFKTKPHCGFEGATAGSQ